MSFGPKPDEPIRINSGPAPRSWDQPAVDAQKAAMWEAAFYAERTKFAAETLRCADLSSENAELHAALAEAREQVARLTGERCPSCDHLASFHSPAVGCFYTVTTGVEGRDLVCVCTATRADQIPTEFGLVIPVFGNVEICPAHDCPRVLCECPPAKDEASGTTAGGDNRA